MRSRQAPLWDRDNQPTAYAGDALVRCAAQQCGAGVPVGGAMVNAAPVMPAAFAALVPGRRVPAGRARRRAMHAPLAINQMRAEDQVQVPGQRMRTEAWTGQRGCGTADVGLLNAARRLGLAFARSLERYKRMNNTNALRQRMFLPVSIFPPQAAGLLRQSKGSGS